MISTSANEKQAHWSIDKLSGKNLFEILMSDLDQFFTLKDLVRMYKINKNNSRK